MEVIKISKGSDKGGLFVRVTRKEAERLIWSLSEQLHRESPNTNRWETFDTKRKYFSIAVQEADMGDAMTPEGPQQISRIERLRNIIDKHVPEARQFPITRGFAEELYRELVALEASLLRMQQERDEWIALIARIAVLQYCDEDEANCSWDSGPYCRHHGDNSCYEKEIHKARRLLSLVQPGVPPVHASRDTTPSQETP